MIPLRLPSEKRKKTKYGNRKTVLDGIRFDSGAEAKYYAELKVRAGKGEVFQVEMQKPFALTVNGQLVCTYKADFHYFDAVADRLRTIDVKGVETDVFRIKRKLMKACHGIDVEVVK